MGKVTISTVLGYKEYVVENIKSILGEDEENSDFRICQGSVQIKQQIFFHSYNSFFCICSKPCNYRKIFIEYRDPQEYSVIVMRL